MKNKLVRPNLFFLLASLILIVIIGILTVALLVPTIAFLLFKFLSSTEGAEGGFVIGIIVGGLSLLLAPLSLIPSYLLSMKLAVYLREKRNWPLTHPRRLFALALLIPVIALFLLVAITHYSS